MADSTSANHSGSISSNVGGGPYVARSHMRRAERTSSTRQFRRNGRGYRASSHGTVPTQDSPQRQQQVIGSYQTSNRTTCSVMHSHVEQRW